MAQKEKNVEQSQNVSHPVREKRWQREKVAQKPRLFLRFIAGATGVVAYAVFLHDKIARQSR